MHAYILKLKLPTASEKNYKIIIPLPITAPPYFMNCRGR